ncbi:Bidirectional sugar transporter SWEET4 [Zea mays]|uniref:Bidirectional sugar transporter SWEET n=1 Tax=Zea mays TaxID=4577 RepID=C0P438_MAIZE|nr:Bidirectional sugar transporter SWEET4 [Zea mays]ACN27754.1 unknown [Zea mays]AQK69754.1 sugars will eventually be exported transporter4b [Zea mays]
MVSSDTIRTAIGVIGNGTALVLFLSPVPTFIRIWKKGSVEQYSPIPYVATLLNCMMWVLYGLPLVHPHSMLVITINGTGMLIQLTYVALFLVYSAGAARRKVSLLLAAEVAFVGAVAALVLALAHTHERRSMVVGILCVLFGTGMYAAPLSVMKMVIQTKSVEYMPLFLSLASLVNGICWTAYALIRFDLYITIPNGLGVLFALAQLLLYAIYYKNTQKIVEARKRKAGQVAMTEVVVDGSRASNNNNNGGSGTY